MINANFTMRTCILAVLTMMATLTNMSCQVRHSEAAQDFRSQRLADSLADLQVADSLRRLALRDRIKDYCTLLEEASIEDSQIESYRFFVEFSWGSSPVGSHLVVHILKTDGLPHINIKSLPASGTRKLTSQQISEAEFQKLAAMFDAVDFESQPIVETVDYQAYDATRYVVEQIEAGHYHGISRSNAVDRFVYQILTETLRAASFDNADLIAEFERLASSKQIRVKD
jgi:hypothetical protein